MFVYGNLRMLEILSLNSITVDMHTLCLKCHLKILAKMYVYTNNNRK